MNDLSAKIQALLFSEGGALSLKALEKALGCTHEEVSAALDALSGALAGSGLTLIRSDTEAVLAVAPVATEVVTKKATDEYGRDIGDAGLEVLAILLYEGASTRAQIDYIRGVNSSSTLRNLLTRGLIERSGNPEDGREFIYRSSVELLALLGTTDRTALPEHGTISAELSSFKASHAAGDTDSPGNPE